MAVEKNGLRQAEFAAERDGKTGYALMTDGRVVRAALRDDAYVRRQREVGRG